MIPVNIFFHKCLDCKFVGRDRVERSPLQQDGVGAAPPSDPAGQWQSLQAA